MLDAVGFLGIDPVWVIIISVLLLILFAYLFKKEKFGIILLGFLRIIASIFYSPLIYFKLLFDSVHNFGEKGEKEFSESNQYLLNKFLIIVKGIWIIVGVFILGSGLVTSYNSFLPPKALREQVSYFEDQLNKLDSTFQVAKSKIDSLDNDWTQNSIDHVRKYKSELQDQINKAIKDNAAILSQYQSNEAYSTIKTIIDESSSAQTVSDFEQGKDRGISYLDYYVYDETVRNTLKTYMENWFIEKANVLKISTATEEIVRSQVQASYAYLKEQNESYNSNSSQQAEYLVNLKKEASYNFVAMGIQLAVTILSFIAFMWFAGLITELLFLTVDLAGNVKKIRTIAEKEFPEKKETDHVTG